MMLYEEILREFQAKKVRYILVGGMAFNLLGGYRNTLDMDILVEMTDKNLARIVLILKRAGYHVKQPVDPMGIADRQTREDWINNKHMKAFNFYKSEQSYEEIDILIESPISYAEAAKDAVKISVKGLRVNVISPKKFLKMKLAAGREKDLWDARDIKTLKGLR